MSYREAHAVNSGSIPAVGRLRVQLCGTVLYIYICINIHSCVVTAVKRVHLRLRAKYSNVCKVAFPVPVTPVTVKILKKLCKFQSYLN